MRPLILISPDVERRGKEFGDHSISLSSMYLEAVERAGGIGLTLPSTISREVVDECVNRCQGVLLTGGDDVEPALYGPPPPPEILKTVSVTPDQGRRDLREFLLVHEVFRQKKPLLAICRGQQVLNVALGGTLYADLPLQRPGSVTHRRSDKRCEVVHEVRLTPDSVLAKITGNRKLGVNSTHHQAVAKVAPPLRVIATAPDGVVEALECKAGLVGLPFLMSVQFHPERLAGRHREHALIFEAFIEACAGS